MNIVLIGFMATGKTSVGKRLAKQLKMKYVDTDSLIEQSTKMTISQIFATKGEPMFRDIESEVIKQSAKFDNHVITLGGGAVLRHENIDSLKPNSVIICLTARAEVIFSRVKEDFTRPLLQKPDPLAEIKRLLQVREQFYKNCNFSVDTSDISINNVVNKIVEYLKTKPFNPIK